MNTAINPVSRLKAPFISWATEIVTASTSAMPQLRIRKQTARWKKKTDSSAPESRSDYCVPSNEPLAHGPRNYLRCYGV